MRRMIAMAALALAACSPIAGERQATPAAPARHPVSGLEVIPVTVTHAGKAHRFRAEVARSGAEQAKGLMFRTSMGADEAMLFPRNPPDRATFWMRNTVIPLDIVYIGTDRRILNIADAKPYDETPLPSAGQTIAVLELNGGRAAELGIVAGDKVAW